MNANLDDVPPRRLLLAASVVAIVVGALTVSLWWFTNLGLLLATVMCVAVIALVAQRLIQSQRRITWETPARAPEEQRGADSRVVTLRHTIERAGRGEAPAVSEVHALLSALAEERLRDRRGLERHTDRAADAALGPDLAAYLDHPPTGRITADQLRRHVHTLEELS